MIFMSVLQKQVNTGENENVSLLSILNLLLQNFVKIIYPRCIQTDSIGIHWYGNISSLGLVLAPSPIQPVKGIIIWEFKGQS